MGYNGFGIESRDLFIRIITNFIIIYYIGCNAAPVELYIFFESDILTTFPTHMKFNQDSNNDVKTKDNKMSLVIDWGNDVGRIYAGFAVIC